MIFNIKVNDNDDLIIKNICYNINYKNIDIPEQPLEIYGFNPILNSYRNKIDKINSDIWKKIRWYINHYDFLVKDPIINRAFYKYWEIINMFNMFQYYDSETDKIFHCAEAPGGFIQGSNIYLQLNNNENHENHENQKKIVDDDGFTMVSKKNNKHKKRNYKIFSISLNRDLPKYKNYNLPSYNNSVINKNVCITYGIDNTGDINNLDNIEFIKKNFNVNCHLVTADGGFDEGTDFNNKEQLHYLLILNEIYSAICLQKNEGHFILKVFDIFTKTSINLLYLLNLIYKEVYIYKPKTSRPTNSEKYIICKYFKVNDSIRKFLLTKLYKLSHELKAQKNKYSSFELFNKIPDSFEKNITQMNTFLLENQCNYLNKAIKLCDDPKFISNYDNELEKSFTKRKIAFQEWQKTYNLNYYIP
jgi:hypothetical protein